MPAVNRTAVLLLNLGSEIAYTAKCLGVDSTIAYDEACRRLVEHFSPVETPEELRGQFQLRRQEPEESIERYSRELRVLAAKAFPNAEEEMLQTLMVTQFVNGIRDPDTRARLILRRCKDLHEAVSAARLSEVANRTVRSSKPTAVFAVGDARRYPSYRQQNPRPQWQQFNNQSQRQFGPIGQRFGPPQYFNQNQRPYGGWPPSSSFPRAAQTFPFKGTCFNCQKVGHRARECRIPVSHVRQTSNRGQSSNRERSPSRERAQNASEYRGTARLRGRDSPYPSQTSLVVQTCNSIETARANLKHSLFVEGNFRNEPVPDMLVDTGSAITIASLQLWKRVKRENEQLLPPDRQFTVANGDSLQVIGQKKIKLQVGSFCEYCEIYIAQNLVHDFVLGIDFLHENKIDILNSVNALQIGDELVPTHRKVLGSTNSIVLAQDTTIGPFEEAVLPGEVNDPEGRFAHLKTYLLEPSTNIEQKHDVLVGRSLNKASQQCVPVLVANVSAQETRMKEGTKLAEIMPVNIEKQVTFAVHADENDAETGAPYSGVESAINNVNPTLSGAQRQRLESLLTQYHDLFAKSADDLGRTRLATHEIDTADARPVRQAPRRLPHEQLKEVDEEVARMLHSGVVKHSQSPWASPIVVVRKKDGSIRLCIDYRKLNSITKKDAHPLPRIEDLLDTLAGSRFFTTLDLASGYHQVEVIERDQEKTAFVTPHGLFEYKVMPFGLCNAPATFQRLMTAVFTGLLGTSCLAYIDDIIVFGRTFEEHQQNLKKVFEKLRAANLKLKPSKCTFAQEKAKFLGHIVSSQGLSTEEEKVAKIINWPIPRNVSELRSFNGLASYYRRFIKNYASIAAPLNRLLELKTPYNWTPDCQAAFDLLKKQLSSAPILSFPNFQEPFVLDTDASDNGIGAVLSQIGNDGKERAISFFSRSLSKAERNYSTTRKELLAFVCAVEHFRCYLYGRSFQVRTDHAALQWLHNFKEPTGQLARWLERLAEYNYEILHRPGRKHSNADAMSRYPVTIVIPQDAWLPLYTPQEFLKQQEDDQVLGQVHQWLREGQRPQKLVVAGTALRYYWARFDQLLQTKGLAAIEKTNEDDTETHIRILVPAALKKQLLEQVHNSPVGGHFGNKKTLHKLCANFHWVGMKRDVEDWVRRCAECSTRKTFKKKRAPLQPSEIGFPFERVAMDILGPLPRTERANRYILVVSDYFTRWPEAYALPNQEASTIARILINEFFARYGVPYQLHSDQGANFDSKLIKELCMMLGIKKTRTTAYHPQSDGLVERLNRTLLDLLSLNAIDVQESWDVQLGLVLMAYRSSVQTSTGFTPYLLLTGREMRVPIDIMYGATPDIQNTHSQAVADVKQKLEKAYTLVRSNLESAQKRQKDYYDRLSNGNRYNVGTKVWLFSPAVGKQVHPKFHRPWTGPWIVQKRISDVTYRIKSSDGKTKVVHFDRLKPYFGEKKQNSESSSESEDETMPQQNAYATPDVQIEIPLIPEEEIPEALQPARRESIDLEQPPQLQKIERKVEEPLPPPPKAKSKVRRKAERTDLPIEGQPFGTDERARTSNYPGLRASTRPPKYFRDYVSSIFFLLLILLPVTLASDPDVIVFPQHGAVAEKCGLVAVDSGSAHFSMILRLDFKMPNMSLMNCTRSLLKNEILATEVAGITPKSYHYLDGWQDYLNVTNMNGPVLKEFSPTSVEQFRIKRNPAIVLPIIGIAAFVLSAGVGVYSLIEVEKLKSQESEMVKYIKGIDGVLTEQHDSLVQGGRLAHSFYEYTYKEFRQVAKQLNELKCKTESLDAGVVILYRKANMINKLYVDRAVAITAVFESKPTPLLLPLPTLKQLIKLNPNFFKDTIYEDLPAMVYHMGNVFPTSPLNGSAIGYILRLPRILKSGLSNYYCVRNIGVKIQDALVRYDLPPTIVWQERAFKSIKTSACASMNQMTYLCAAALHLQDAPCISDLKICRYQARRLQKTEWLGGSYGYALTSPTSCHIVDKYSFKRKLDSNNGFHYITFNGTAAISCDDGLVLPMEMRSFIYAYHYGYNITSVNSELLTYVTSEWKDASKLEELRSRLDSNKLEKLKHLLDGSVDIEFWSLLALTTAVLIMFAWWLLTRKCIRRVLFPCSACARLRELSRKNDAKGRERPDRVRFTAAARADESAGRRETTKAKANRAALQVPSSDDMIRLDF